jgi:hypothetical protein
MLRTTNKSVINQLKIDVLENFAETAEWERDNGDETATPLSCLVSQIDYMRYGNRSIYATALDYAEGGSMLIYYDEQRDYLKNLLEETTEDSQRFSDDQVFKKYCHLMARTMAQLYAEGK